jgi:hypothetical protein
MISFDDSDLEDLYRRERLQGARFGLGILVLSALLVIVCVAIAMF